MAEDLCRNIELILSDVDGVMTDGRIIFDNQGLESKQFFVRDGLGIKLWQRAGYPFGIVTARNSEIVTIRAAELKIKIVRQGATEKLSTVKQILAELNLEPEQLCYIGDDLADLAPISLAGLGVAVADACPEIRSEANMVTETRGGTGAVRETIERVLKAQNRWDDLISQYYR